jgi:hypothetical protein
MRMQKTEQAEEAGMVTVSAVMPAEWRDKLAELARVRAAHRGENYSRAALLRDLLGPVMEAVRLEIDQSKARKRKGRGS